MLDLAIQFLLQNPIAMKVVVIILAARAIFKPLCIAAQKYVDETETKADDAFLAKVQANAIYKGIHFVLDYVFSLKLPTVPVEKPVENPPAQ